MIAIFTGTRRITSVIEHEVALALDWIGPAAIVHVGDCPTGVDLVVAERCEWWGLDFVVHRADWGMHGRAAGPLRNQAMVDAAARAAGEAHDELVCFAFPRGESRGTWDCIRRALAAGATLRIVEVPE